MYIYIKSKTGIVNQKKLLNGTWPGKSEAIFGLSVSMDMSTNQGIHEIVTISSGCGANKNPHKLPHPPMVNNAHPVTWTPCDKFLPGWSINEFLAGMTSYGCNNDQTTPIDTHTCDL